MRIVFVDDLRTELHRHRVDGDEKHRQGDHSEQASRGGQVFENGGDRCDDLVEIEVVEQVFGKLARREIVLFGQVDDVLDEAFEASRIALESFGQVDEGPHGQADHSQQEAEQGGHREDGRKPGRQPLAYEPPVDGPHGEDERERKKGRAKQVADLVQPDAAERHKGEDDERLHPRRKGPPPILCGMLRHDLAHCRLGVPA